MTHLTRPDRSGRMRLTQRGERVRNRLVVGLLLIGAFLLGMSSIWDYLPWAVTLH